MSRVSATRVQGIGIVDERISPTSLQAKGVGSTDSDYSEAGPLPGVPEPAQDSAMVLQASGSQSDDGDVQIRTLRAGGPGPGNKAGGFAYLDAAASETLYMGWDGYQAVTGMDVLFAGSGSAGGSLPGVVRLANRKVVVCYEEAGAVLSPSVQFQRYDPATQAWSTLTQLSVQGSMNDQVCPCLVEIPEDGRLLFYVVNASGRNLILMTSDDDGDTWSLMSHHVLVEDLPAGATINQVRGAYDGNTVVLFVQYTSSAPAAEVAQYASSDRGARFDQVTSAWAIAFDLPDAISVAALPGGGFVLAFNEGDATPRYKSCRIGSGYEDVQGVEEVDINATIAPSGSPSVAIWLDEDGALYALIALTTGGGTDYLALYRSLDRGDSWQGWPGPVAELFPGAATAEFQDFAATSTGGLGLLVTRYTVPVQNDSDSAVVCLYLGGHGSHTLPATTASNENFADTDFICWSEDDSLNAGGFWCSIELPNNIGWTGIGAGTGTITADLELRISTAGAQGRSYRRQVTSTALDTLVCEFEVQWISGGSLSTKEIAAEFVLSDYDGTPGSATFTYALSVRIASTGWRLYDDNAGAQVGSTVVQGMSSRRKIRIAIDSGGHALTWHAAHGPQRTKWTAGPASTSLTNTPADVPNEIEFGHIANGTTASEWIHVGYCFWGERWAAPSHTAFPLANFWVNPTDIHPRAYSGLPVLVHDGVLVAAVDGPSLEGEVWNVRPEHTYAVDNIFPSISPSPRRVWRSAADSVEEILSFALDADFTSSRLRNHALFVLLLNSNLETAVIETWDGAAWSALVTLDSTAGWTGLQYDRRGRMLIPRTGVSQTAARYFHAAAHEGDTFDLTGGLANHLHRIGRNTEGAWHSDSTVKRPTIRLADANLPGGLVSQEFGTGKIRRKDFGAIVHSYNDDDYFLRLRIPSQETAEGYYQIGQLLIGHVAVFGHEYDSGWSVTREFNADLFRRLDGVRFGRTNGPSRRVVEFAWAETAVDASRVQVNDPVPDFLGGQDAVDQGIATPNDVLHLVEGIALESEGPALPVVYLARVPTNADASHPLTDWHEFVYGRLETDPRRDNVIGDEARTELNRTPTLTIREEV